MVGKIEVTLRNPVVDILMKGTRFTHPWKTWGIGGRGRALEISARSSEVGFPVGTAAVPRGLWATFPVSCCVQEGLVRSPRRVSVTSCRPSLGLSLRAMRLISLWVEETQKVVVTKHGQQTVLCQECVGSDGACVMLRKAFSCPESTCPSRRGMGLLEAGEAE